MTGIRVLLAVVLIAGCGLPVVAPVWAAWTSPASRSAFAESERLLSLAENTAALAAIAVALAVPLGAALAVVTQRLPVWGRRGIRAAVLVGLFLPLPVYAVAWQAVLGSWLPPLMLEPGAVAWRAWNVGLMPAGFVHGMAGVPWVAWVVSEALTRTDRDLEDDAAQTGGNWVVLRRVILPRALLATLVAAGWVTVQTATEIPVTDAMMVRTFAEEVYTQLVSGGDGVASAAALATAVTIPVWLAGILAGTWVARRVNVSPTVSVPQPLRFTPWVSPIASLFAWGVVALFVGLPLTALVRKAGGSTFTAGELLQQLGITARANSSVLLSNTIWAAVTGVVVAAVARWACWLAARSRWFAGFLLAMCVVLFLTPGPLVGLGLKAVINGLLDLEDGLFAAVAWKPSYPPLATLLYYQPSPLPAAWAAAVRLLPVACVVIWPAVRAVPRELWEAVVIDGHGWRGEWRLVAGPFTRTAFVRAAVAVAALTLGEVSASKLVSPPGYESFVMRLFAQMHYGAESTVAALALVQFGLCVLVVGVSNTLNRRSGFPL